MAFIAVDLKVIEGLASSVSRAAEVSEDRVLAGLVRLWHRCWSQSTDLVTPKELGGVLGGERLTELIDALETFGFLEDVAGGFRIRGASRYIRLRESRRKGGKAAANHRRIAGRFAGPPALEPVSQPALEPVGAGGPTGTKPALSPNTEHRTPNTERELKTLAEASLSAPVIKAKEPTGRLKPLTELLVAEYLKARGSKYKHGGAKDATALKSLLSVASDEEIVRRWRIGLASAGWLQTSTFAQLGSKWNDITGADNKPKRDITKGTFRAEDATAKDHDEGFAF